MLLKICLLNVWAGCNGKDSGLNVRSKMVKSECGMADYQVRKWQAWHHHMALVMMSMLFMLTEKIRHKDIYPLLSCSDIEELLAHFLPRRDLNKEDLILQMEYRHAQRQKAIDSHARRNKLFIKLE